MSRPFYWKNQMTCVFGNTGVEWSVISKLKSSTVEAEGERRWVGNSALTVLRGAGYFWDSQNLELELRASISFRIEQRRMFSYPSLDYNGYAPGVRDGDRASTNSFSSWGHRLKQRLLKEKAEDGPGSIGLQLLHAEAWCRRAKSSGLTGVIWQDCIKKIVGKKHTKTGWRNQCTRNERGEGLRSHGKGWYVCVGDVGV